MINQDLIDKEQVWHNKIKNNYETEILTTHTQPDKKRI